MLGGKQCIFLITTFRMKWLLFPSSYKNSSPKQTRIHTNPNKKQTNQHTDTKSISRPSDVRPVQKTDQWKISISQTSMTYFTKQFYDWSTERNLPIDCCLVHVTFPHFISKQRGILFFTRSRGKTTTEADKLYIFNWVKNNLR